MPLSRRDAVNLLGLGFSGALLGGCGGSGATLGPSIPSNPQPPPSGGTTDVTVTVSASVVGSVGPGFASLSYEKDSFALPRFTPGNSDLIGLFKRLGVGILRIGGNSVDKTTWNPNGSGQVSGQVAPPDVEALAGFLQASGWSVLYGVNLATSTPQLAAAEVAYVQQTLGKSLHAIEIGNEPDLYGGVYFPTFTLSDFEQRWAGFRSAILQSAPGVTITGPASAGNVGTWTVPFGIAVGSSELALLTQHYYRGNGQSASSTIEELLSPDTKLAATLATLRQGAASIGVPFRLTETNSFYNGGASGVSDSYASALWVINHLFAIALGGAVGANLHGGGDGSGYTPIADSAGVVVAARPEYYGMLMFTLTGAGSLLGTSVAASGLNVTAYAVSAAVGSVNLMVVNSDATQNLSLSIATGQSVASAQLSVLSGTALDATTGTAIQGASVGVDGSFTPDAPYTAQVKSGTVSCYVPAASAALISWS